MAEPESIRWGFLVMGLLGGLAVFLYGMENLSDSLKAIAGKGMKTALEKLTTNRFLGVATGAGITAVIQSSSVTTVLLVGFIAAGLMTVENAIGVIMGANIGSTVTAQIIAFNVTKYASGLIAAGFALSFLSKKRQVKSYGVLILGLGFIFLGMDLMSSSTHPLRTYEPFIDLMKEMERPASGILLGLVFTAIVQSSAATTGIVIALASQGLVTLEAGIAICFGANIGTCATALLAAIGKDREPLQAALAHILFNVAGVLVWVGFIPELAAWMRAISPVATDLTGAAKMAAEAPRQIANAHTFFNIANTVIFIWFTKPFAALVSRLVPARPKTAEDQIRPRFLSEAALEAGQLAIENVRHELHHFSQEVLCLAETIQQTVHSGETADFEKMEKTRVGLEALDEAILRYLSAIRQDRLSENDVQSLQALVSVANYLDDIARTLTKNLRELGLERLDALKTLQSKRKGKATPLASAVIEVLRETTEAINSWDVSTAQSITTKEETIEKLYNDAKRALQRSLLGDKPEAEELRIFRWESDFLENIKRIYYFAYRIARKIT